MKIEIRICANHKIQIPLIWTFAFSGAEYWCPYCGSTYGMLGAGIKVEETKELKQAGREWKKKTRKFLSAKSTLTCDAKLIKGVFVKRKDFPISMVEKARKIVKEFQYEAELNAL